MRIIRSPRPWALAVLIVAGACRSPTADAAVAEHLAQMSDALVAQRDQLAMLTTTVDSLAIDRPPNFLMGDGAAGPQVDPEMHHLAHHGGPRRA